MFYNVSLFHQSERKMENNKLTYTAAQQTLLSSGFTLVCDKFWKCITFKSETQMAYVIANPGHGYTIEKYDIIAEA